ncbi:MAG: GspH/FimT family pseudopilin [Thioalkalivibrionaceae bacterium]
MVCVSILGITASLGSAGFGALQASAQKTDAVNTVQTTLQFARSEAVKRNQTISVCASTDAATCNADWTDFNQLIVVDATGVLLREAVTLPASAKIVQAPFSGPLHYRPAGNLDGLDGAQLSAGAAQLTLSISDRQTGCVELLPSGHTRVVQPGDPRPCGLSGVEA